MSEIHLYETVLTQSRSGAYWEFWKASFKGRLKT